MASPSQSWAKDAESGGAYAAGHASGPDDSGAFADVDRFGTTQKGNPTPIRTPQNKVSDPVWGINAPDGGVNPPDAPEIPVTKGE